MQTIDFIGMDNDLQAKIYVRVENYVPSIPPNNSMERLMDAIHDETVRTLLENVTICPSCGADPDTFELIEKLKKAKCKCGNLQFTGA